MRRQARSNTRSVRENPGADDQEHDEGSASISTYLVVPYFPADRGRPTIERPLNASIPSWLCPSIIVNGQPGKNAFQRGTPTSVTVDVSNWGTGTVTAPVQVWLWWADPSVGFTNKTLLGQSVVAVPTGGGVRRSPPIVGTIPTSAPPHVCLLAYVSSPLDSLPAGSPVDPVNNRHWAQLNIVEITTSASGKFDFMFWAGNPLQRATGFDIVMRVVPREAQPTVERLFRAEILLLERAEVYIDELRRVDEAQSRRVDSRYRHQITLEPGQRRAFHAKGQLPEGVEPGARAAFEIQQVGLGEDQRIYGSIGLIVTAKDRH